MLPGHLFGGRRCPASPFSLKSIRFREVLHHAVHDVAGFQLIPDDHSFMLKIHHLMVMARADNR